MATAGQKRERISLCRKSRTQRTDGGYDTAYIVYSTIWAAVSPVAPNDQEEVGRKFGRTNFLVDMYARDKPTALSVDWLLRWDTAPGGAVFLAIEGIRLADIRSTDLRLVARSTDDVPSIAGIGANTLEWDGEALQWDGEDLQWAA